MECRGVTFGFRVEDEVCLSLTVKTHRLRLVLTDFLESETVSDEAFESGQFGGSTGELDKLYATDFGG